MAPLLGHKIRLVTTSLGFDAFSKSIFDMPVQIEVCVSIKFHFTHELLLGVLEK